MQEELKSKIVSVRYGISRPNVLDGTYRRDFIDLGLEWLTLCEFGSKRSCDGAKRATYTHNVPTMFLIGGLKGLQEYFNYQTMLSEIINTINKTPQVAVILKPHEVPFYLNILPLINHRIFPSEDHFIDHIS